MLSTVEGGEVMCIHSKDACSLPPPKKHKPRVEEDRQVLSGLHRKDIKVSPYLPGHSSFILAGKLLPNL